MMTNNSDRLAGTTGMVLTARAATARQSIQGYARLRLTTMQTPMAGDALPSHMGHRAGNADSPPRSTTAETNRYPIPEQYRETIWVQSSRRGIIRLKSPMLHVLVSDEDRDGVFVASDTFSTVFGAGESAVEAINEYIEQLFHHFDALDREEDRLAPGLRKVLIALRERFVREA